MGSWRSSARRSRSRTHRAAPCLGALAIQRAPRDAGRGGARRATASSSACASASTPGRWSSVASATTCAWTTPPWATRRTSPRASRRRANPGEVLISEAIRRLVADFFELEDLGEQEIKGKSEPVRVYRVVADRAVSGRIDAVAASGLTPLVGRQQELAALRAAFESARDGRGQVVLPGRARRASASRDSSTSFAASLEDEPHAWFEGRCASYAGDHGLPRRSSTALRRASGIDDRDDDDAALAKIGARRAWRRRRSRLDAPLPAQAPLAPGRATRPSTRSTPSRAAARPSEPCTRSSCGRPSGSRWSS